MDHLPVPNQNESNPMPVEKLKEYLAQLDFGLMKADEFFSKKYISTLRSLKVVEFSKDKDIEREVGEENPKNNLINVCLFRIKEMVYEKDEFASHKFATVFNALSNFNCALFLIIDSDGQNTSFYMGTRSDDTDKYYTSETAIDTLKKALLGQFPGIKIEDVEENEEIGQFIKKIEAEALSTVSCIANVRDSENKLNQAFVQGLEKFALSMQGEKYTAVVLAHSTSREELDNQRRQCERIYTTLSPFASRQGSYSINSSKTWADAISCIKTYGESITEEIARTTSKSEMSSMGTSESLSGRNGLMATAAAFFTGGALGETKTNAEFQSNTEESGVADTQSSAHGEHKDISKGNIQTTGEQTGISQTITLSQQDKTIIGILERIDTQLKRIKEFESLGMWECAAYFMAKDLATTEKAAFLYKSLMSGENSGVEASAVNSWLNISPDSENFQTLIKYVKNFMHPVFKYPITCEDKNKGNDGTKDVTPAVYVSGNELALHMGLPRHPVRGFPVIEHASFPPDIVYYDSEDRPNNVDIGSIFNMGSDEPKARVMLERNSLTMHTFVTGTTGSGKSNVVYVMLNELMKAGIKFTVIEPAKGEYKNIFGTREDVKVFGTNPLCSVLLRINPFSFPTGVSISEHIDRLLDVFNVCWPMYAAMPAVLEDALNKAYEGCGWDLQSSKNRYSTDMFPTFTDLLKELTNVISDSAYSDETKKDYTGALCTRVKSLTNGLNGQIFSADEVDSELLFDENVIIDLSRVSSLKTKALIMGILLIRLYEHRMTHSEGMNQELKHVTVLEEAHNLLKRTPTEQNTEAPSLLGKSVEMISNAIAEMRTYGEGFVIADQSPNAVDASAIRNTNTKIIMRLPDEDDRRISGKSAALKDEQLDEIAKLPRGVAVVYQNDWVAPVLCRINKFNSEEGKYNYTPSDEQFDERRLKHELVKLLLKGRTSDEAEPDIKLIERDLKKLQVLTKIKLDILPLIKEYSENRKLAIWEDDNFYKLAWLVTELICGKERLERVINSKKPVPEICNDLSHEVNEWLSGLSGTLKTSVCQCLMWEYSWSDKKRHELYKAWMDCVQRRWS